jgi:hypothetical protein
MVCGEEGLLCNRSLDRTALHRGRGGPYGVCGSSWRNTGSPRDGQATDSPGRKASQCPGGRGGGSKRRPSGHRRERATQAGGETQPARVLTAHGSSRQRRRQGNGKHGPYGGATSGTERPWLSTESSQPALSDLPSGLCHCRSIGLSGMRGNSPVPFGGGGDLATGSCYPTVRCAPAARRA